MLAPRKVLGLSKDKAEEIAVKQLTQRRSRARKLKSIPEPHVGRPAAGMGDRPALAMSPGIYAV